TRPDGRPRASRAHTGRSRRSAAVSSDSSGRGPAAVQRDRPRVTHDRELHDAEAADARPRSMVGRLGLMKRQWGPRLAGIAAVAGLWLVAAPVASGDVPFPGCNRQPECSSGWYTSPVSVTWNLNGSSNGGGCASQSYSDDTDQSSVPDGALPS